MVRETTGYYAALFIASFVVIILTIQSVGLQLNTRVLALFATFLLLLQVLVSISILHHFENMAS